MKIKFSKALIVLLALFLPVILGGCKKKCPKPEKNIPGTGAFRSDCPYKDPSAGAGGKKEIDFYIVFDNTDAFKQQIQAFQSKNPGVTVRIKKFANLKEYENSVVSEIAEGQGPDVFMVHNSWIPRHFKKLLPEPADLPLVVSPELFRQTFFQAAADDLILDEKIYGMPLAIDNLAIYYNKSYFKDLLATTDEPGALWEVIREQVFELTKRNNSPERFALSGLGIGRADNVARAVDVLYALMLQYGVNFYGEKGDKASFAERGVPGEGIDNPGESALSLYTSFGLPSYKNYSWNDTITGYAPDQKEAGAFARGKTAMIAGYPWLYDQLVLIIQNQQKAGEPHIDVEDIGVAPFPQLISGTESPRRDTLASYYPLVVARTSDLPRESWNLIQYLVSADSLQTYHKITKRPTSRKDMVTDQQTETIFGVFAYQAPFAKSFKVYDMDAYNAVFSDAIQKVVESLATPGEALKEAQDKITCVVQKQKELTGQDRDCGI